jgi:hypothetical protein
MRTNGLSRTVVKRFMKTVVNLAVNTEVAVFCNVTPCRTVNCTDVSEESVILKLKEAARILRNFVYLFYILHDVTSTMTVMSN